MEKLKIIYKIKNFIDNELERDIQKLAKKHKFVKTGGGFNAEIQERNMTFERVGEGENGIQSNERR